jgi:hypothetical protein
MMARKIWQFAALGIACAALAACGSSSGSKSSGSSSDTKSSSNPTTSSKDKIAVCKIITPEAAATVVGSPAKEEAPSGPELATAGVCIYKRDTTDIAVNLLQARVYNGPQFYGERIFPDAKTITVKGADKAFLNIKTAGAGAANYDLQFVKNGKTGALNYTATKGADEATTTPALENLANQLAAAL